MASYFMFLAIVFPILMAIPVVLIPFKKRTHMMLYVETIVILTSLLVLLLEMNTPTGVFTLFRFEDNLTVAFQMDGLGRIFMGMVSLLWPLATLYAFEYMKHEGHEKYFFMFYTATFGVTLGVAQAENILTLYLFFEALSMITLPLIMHTLSREAIHASRTYLYYMIGGAAFAFIGMIFIITYGTTGSFIPGGVFDIASMTDKRKNLLLLVYVMCFCGLSVKAALFPFSSWLPKAGVAPTPVTALLHAVAVVKTGVFAAMRLTYYSFGADFLRGTWAQNLLMTMTIITIVYGSARALKETHFKRRLAWSTVSNLSYILFAVTQMSEAGLKGAMGHMVCHAFMKICAFFCAGAVIYKTGKNYIHDMDGFGRKMPVVFLAFTVSGFGLMGVPGFCGFISKWKIVEAALESHNILSDIGIAALLVSALLTAIYMLTISVRAFMPAKGFDYTTVAKVEDPNWMMLLPLVCFIVVMIVLGLYPQLLINLINSAVTGI